MDKPNTIVVTTKSTGKICAVSAEMYVVIEGHSFFTATEALNKSREVNKFVTDLAKIGIQPENIEITGIKAVVSSGIINKSSSAEYNLKIIIPSIDMVSDTLSMVTSCKNIELKNLIWVAEDEEKLHNAMLEEALQKSKVRADLICKTISHENLGVHGLTERFEENKHQLMNFEICELSDHSKFDFGIELNHSINVVVEVRVEYLVKPCK